MRCTPAWTSTLVALLLTAAAGCDAPSDPMDGDVDAAETYGDVDPVGDDSQDEDPSADPGADPGIDPDTPHVPEPADPDADPFDNDPQTALGALSGMWYACYAGQDYYDLFFEAGDRLRIRDNDGAEALGSYSTSGSSLTVSVPDLAFTESSTDGWVELDALVQFSTPSLVCNAVALDHTQPADPLIVKCPSIKYVPEVGWEDNEFQFGLGGDVFRRRWTELSGANDTLYARIYGVYVRLGDQVYMVFPGVDDDTETYLTGTVTDEGLFIHELEPEKGACN
jgi:hypothetical protein